MKILPWALSGVFGVLSIVFIVLYAVAKAVRNPIDESHFIPVKQECLNSGIGGAKQFQTKKDILDSEYFKNLDIYNMESTKTRSIISHFKTYQQTSEYSAYCAVMIMVANYFNKTIPSERQCMIDFGVDDIADRKDEEVGVDGEFMKHFMVDSSIDYLKNKLGLKISTNDKEKYPDTDGYPFEDDYMPFSKWVQETIKKGDIIITPCVDWSNSVLIIIGVDTMGTEDYSGDDVLIVADPYDTTDHIQDGYNIWGLERFYAMWRYTINQEIAFPGGVSPGMAVNQHNYDVSYGQFIVVHRS